MPTDKPTDALDSLRNQVHDWHRRAFPDAAALPCALHLLEEAQELVDAIRDGEGTERVAEEAADVLMLLFGLERVGGFHLVHAGFHKLTRNRRRTYGPPDENGVRRHVK